MADDMNQSPDDGGAAGQPDADITNDDQQPGIEPDAGEPSGDVLSGDEPVTYETPTLPDGMTMDQGLLDSFTPVAQEMGLSQEQFQKMVDVYAGSITEQQQSLMEQTSTQINEWQTAAEADKEYGGEAFDANVGVANLAIKQFGSPELIQYLADSGAGNHPEMIRFAYRVGKLLQEDQPGLGGSPHKEKSVTEILYGTS